VLTWGIAMKIAIHVNPVSGQMCGNVVLVLLSIGIILIYGDGI